MVSFVFVLSTRPQFAVDRYVVLHLALMVGVLSVIVGDCAVVLEIVGATLAK